MNPEGQVESDIPSTVLTFLSKQPQEPNKTPNQTILKLDFSPKSETCCQGVWRRVRPIQMQLHFEVA